MFKNENVIIYNSSLSSLKPVCQEWISIINTYCKKLEEEVPYYYNERANISLFAGALWRKKSLVMEEFQLEKGKSEKYTGRCDLWFMLNKVSYFCETKMKFLSLDSRDLKSRIKEQVKLAKDDVRKI